MSVFHLDSNVFTFYAYLNTLLPAFLTKFEIDNRFQYLSVLLSYEYVGLILLFIETIIC